MSAPVRLKTAIATYGYTARLKDGGVPVDGVALDFVEVAPIVAAYRRMVRHLEFDVCEMAPTTYMIARALGAPYIALPVFVMRRFITPAWYAGPIPAFAVPSICTARRSACAPIR